MDILNSLLSRSNDGRRKTPFCPAVNLLELEDLTAILAEADAAAQALPIKEKAARITALFQACAKN